MSAEQVCAFIAFAFVAAVTPGPSNVMLTATGASVGVVRGLPALVGVGVGMGSMIAVVAFGLGSVVIGSPAVLTALKWCGAVFLLWAAWKIGTADASGAGEGGRPVGFFEAAVFQWVNPKAWLVSASAAGTYLDAGAGSAVAQAVQLGLHCALPLKRDEAKAADDLTITEPARGADESTHMAMALTSHTGPNVAHQRPAQAGEARRSGSAGWTGSAPAFAWGYRSSGFRPVCLAIRASIRGPISSRS